MKIKQILINLIILAVSLNASDFSQIEIRKAGERFIRQEPLYKMSGENYTIDQIEPLFFESNDGTAAWIVHLSPAGFILFSADSSLNPILGYSHDSHFKGRAVTLDMIRGDVGRRIRNINEQKKPASLIEEHRRQWHSLLSERGMGKIRSNTTAEDDSIYYFATPVWGQGYVNGSAVFNYYTPNQWSTGCVATAMAEALAYYQWPPNGTGSHCYNEDDAGQLCADFEETFYDWPNMLDLYKGVATTSAQRKAAGLLSYHTAISLEMDFESSGSTAETADAPDALHHYFRCSGQYKSVNSPGFWSEMENNMKDARPALLSIKRTDGLGHSVVVDGFYKGKYHLNMGWDGDDNGFYDIAGSWNAGGYTIVVGAAKGIVPNPVILPEICQQSEKSYVLSWTVSPKQQAQYYELQQATASAGPWTTLNAAVADTFIQVDINEARNYYYRVRTRRNDIWWDWSAVQKIAMGGPRQITFNVNMKYQTLAGEDSVVVRGNIVPLSGSRNSNAFDDADGDRIYSLTLPFDFDHAGEELSYRFAIAGNGSTKMESFSRTHIIGLEEYQNLDTVFFDNYVSIAEVQPNFPKDIRLYQNYPNPFNPSTTINYELPITNYVELVVYNALGQKVRTLVSKRQAAGKYSLTFDTSALSSGIYYYQLSVNGKSRIRKMVLLR